MPTETFTIPDGTTVKVIPPPFQRRRSASFSPFPEVEHSIPCRSPYYDLNRERGSPRSDLPSAVPIFPWETRPRHTPRRVFPGDGVPTPGTPPFTSTVPSGYLSALPSPFHDIFRSPTNAGDTNVVRKKSSKFRLHIPPSPLAPSSMMSEGLRKPRAAKGEAGGAEDEGSMKRDTHVQSPGENIKPTRRASCRFVDIGVCNDLRNLKDKAVQVETASGNSVDSPQEVGTTLQSPLLA